MHRIAKVVVDIAVGREFDYAIPSSLQDTVRLGSRVTVPFGRSRRAGYVVGVCDRSDVENLKDIISVTGDKPLIDEKILGLARWMADYYCMPVEHAIRSVLPAAVRRAGARFKKRKVVELREAGSGKREAGSGEREEKALSPKQEAVVQLLQGEGNMLLSEVTQKLAITAAPVKALEKKGIVTVRSEAVGRNPLADRNILRTQHLDLMPEQQAALDMIKECIEARSARQQVEQDVAAAAKAVDKTGREPGKETGSGVVLLHGVTGSGKTEVYIQAIDYVIAEGKGAIVLVPEISLTPQTVERFVSRFGDRIAVLHSHLSDGERHDEWHRIRNGEADIVIGARSAVFAPVPELGLIVVDEEHEPSYKQEDAPRYGARDVAVMRGHLEKCAVVLGSATPCIESWHNANTGKYALAVLPHRADNRRMPAMRVIDMRVETERAGHVSVFSKDLLDAMGARLARAEQTILFLNRRGFATSLVCPKCGNVARCDQCSVSYTYHKGIDELRCHICGGARTTPKRCAKCGDPAFKFAGVGTQRVESIVKKCFPHAQVQRMDTDITTRKDSYERILGDFRVGRTDILVGTQMIAKGLHFPNVTLVGVIYADLSLHMPDFRAGERTFQLLAQVAGRAGRGETPGEVIVQTYTPFHVAVQAARRLDYEGFCDQEIEFRRELKYPPFTHLVCITLKGPADAKVSFCASTLARQLGKAVSGNVLVSDAAPAPIARAKGNYRYQVMLRCPSTRAMTGPLEKVLKESKLPPDVSCSVDVDALSLL